MKRAAADGARLRHGDHQRRGARFGNAVRRGNIGIVGASGTGARN